MSDGSVKTVWTFNGKKEYMFTGNGPSLNNPRSNHACSIFRSEAHGGKPVIVVAGGKSQKGAFSPSKLANSSHNYLKQFTIYHLD